MDLKQTPNAKDESPQGPPPPPPPKKRTPLPNSPMNRLLYRCFHCSSGFSNADLLAKHIANVHGTLCHICGEPVSPAGMETHQSHMHPEGSMAAPPLSYSEDESFISTSDEEELSDIKMEDVDEEPASTLQDTPTSTHRREKRKDWDARATNRKREAREREMKNIPEPKAKTTRRPKAATEEERIERVRERQQGYRRIRREKAQEERQRAAAEEERIRREKAQEGIQGLARAAVDAIHAEEAARAARGEDPEHAVVPTEHAATFQAMATEEERKLKPKTQRPKAATEEERRERLRERGQRYQAEKRRQKKEIEKPKPTVQCEICLTHFYRQEDLDEHMKRIHTH